MKNSLESSRVHKKSSQFLTGSVFGIRINFYKPEKLSKDSSFSPKKMATDFFKSSFLKYFKFLVESQKLFLHLSIGFEDILKNLEEFYNHFGEISILIKNVQWVPK